MEISLGTLLDFHVPLQHCSGYGFAIAPFFVCVFFDVSPGRHLYDDISHDYDHLADSI